MNRVVDFLVLGSKGMLGHLITTYLREQGFYVIGVSRSTASHSDEVMLDLRDFLVLERLVKESEAKMIVNCVGLLNEDADNNRYDSIVINSLLPLVLERITKELPTRVIQISTDCVFSGNKGSYSPQDIPDPKDHYGRTKFLGELNNTKDLTIRTSIVGPDSKRNGIGLFNWFMKQNANVSGYKNAMWSGVTTLQLAKFIEYLYDHELTGLIHYTNNFKISKFELLQLFNQWRTSPVVITAVDTIPTDKSLMNPNSFESHVVPSYEEMIVDMVQWIHRHLKKYNHYVEVLK